ncbi:hypothetical protein ACVGVM_11150 [Pseudonocardia bannensis]
MTSSLHHVHDRRCYWDLNRCGWVCPAPPPVPPADEVRPTAPASDPAGDADVVAPPARVIS